MIFILGTLKENGAKEKIRLIEQLEEQEICRYERDEMLPSIGVAKKLAALLDTTVGYLLGENEDNQLLKNPKILQRLQDIQKLADNEQEHIFITLDALIRDFKNRKAYAS